MNEPDLSAFTALWQQEPAEEEVRIFRKLAARTTRRARLLRRAETWAGLVLALGIMTAFAVAPGLLTGAMAMLLAASVLWTALQRHRLDEAEAQLSRQDRHALLETSEASARAALRRSMLGMVTAAPGGVATIALLDLVARGGSGREWIAGLPAIVGSSSFLVSAGLVSAVTWGAWRHNRRLRRELQRIAVLRRAYCEEDMLDRDIEERKQRG